MKGSNDSMMLRGADAPALGVEERSDEAPRAGGAATPRAPDPEVVAKPTRRRFSAEYRLRILEEADRCTQPGEIGRLLRREGLYSSHLSVWRKARRNGSLKALTPKKRGAKPAEPKSSKWQGPPARSEGGAPGEGTGHRATRFWTCREKLPGCWD